MSQQTIRQQARRTAREMAVKRRTERAERERRVIELAEQVMVAIGERDAAVTSHPSRGRPVGPGCHTEPIEVIEAIERAGATVAAIHLASDSASHYVNQLATLADLVPQYFFD